MLLVISLSTLFSLSFLAVNQLVVIGLEFVVNLHSNWHLSLSLSELCVCVCLSRCLCVCLCCMCDWSVPWNWICYGSRDV